MLRGVCFGIFCDFNSVRVPPFLSGVEIGVSNLERPSDRGLGGPFSRRATSGSLWFHWHIGYSTVESRPLDKNAKRFSPRERNGSRWPSSHGRTTLVENTGYHCPCVILKSPSLLLICSHPRERPILSPRILLNIPVSLWVHSYTQTLSLNCERALVLR